MLAVALLARCLLPVWLFHSERLLRTSSDDPGTSLSSMMVGRMDLMTGLAAGSQAMQESDPEKRAQIISASGFNALGPLLGPEEQILALGNAAPFLSPRGFEYATVWDNHPMAELLEQHPGDPDGVIRGLNERGTTMILLNYPMLQRWLESGWLDPRLDPDALQEVLARMDVQFRWQNGEVLYRVPGLGGPSIVPSAKTPREADSKTDPGQP